MNIYNHKKTRCQWQSLAFSWYEDGVRDLGFTQLLPLDTFKDDSNGYLVNDSCEFGVEVLIVNEQDIKSEGLSPINDDLKAFSFPGNIIPPDKVYSETEICSPEFNHGGYTW